MANNFSFEAKFIFLHLHKFVKNCLWAKRHVRTKDCSLFTTNIDFIRKFEENTFA